ncbi:hemagglutinin [Neisseria meningitidis]|nr:hemagglutinin [Neisseria meningitidis]MBJ7805126.1 hemagglutinin [Neisseria meningitidis]
MRKVCASARTRSMIYSSMPSEKLTIFQTAFVMQVNIQIPYILPRHVRAEDTPYACCRTFG